VELDAFPLSQEKNKQKKQTTQKEKEEEHKGEK